MDILKLATQNKNKSRLLKGCETSQDAPGRTIAVYRKETSVGVLRTLQIAS